MYVRFNLLTLHKIIHHDEIYFYTYIISSSIVGNGTVCVGKARQHGRT